MPVMTDTRSVTFRQVRKGSRGSRSSRNIVEVAQQRQLFEGVAAVEGDSSGVVRHNVEVQGARHLALRVRHHQPQQVGCNALRGLDRAVSKLDWQGSASSETGVKEVAASLARIIDMQTPLQAAS